MPAAATEGPPVALSLAEKAMCKVVYGAPRPRPLLLPVGLELWLYVQKMRNLQRKRCGGGWVRAGGHHAVAGSWDKEGGGASDLGRPAWCLPRWPPHVQAWLAFPVCRSRRQLQTPQHCAPAPLTSRPRALPKPETSSALSH